MGGGRWTEEAFDEYAIGSWGISGKEAEKARMSTQQVFRKMRLSNVLNPYEVTRTCHDSEEHPNTVPVILALDVTGSMGAAAVKTATGLNKIITEIFRSGKVRDVEFCVMGIGDLHYDNAPIQISQFESDIRIAEQMDEIWFEGGGGGNVFESYTAAWYMGTRHCDLDCWKRGRKGLILTLGDELPNPYLSAAELKAVTGDSLQADIETESLLEETQKKYEIYHFSVNDNQSSYRRNQERNNLDGAWSQLLGKDHYRVVTIDSLAGEVSGIIERFACAGDQKNGPIAPHLW